MGQLDSGPSSGEDAGSRDLAEQWLRQAREAMEKGDLDLAKQYVDRAEKLHVHYNPITSKFKDTPAKVRKDLQELRAGKDDSKFSPSAAISKLFKRGNSAESPNDAYGQASPSVARAEQATSAPGQRPSASSLGTPAAVPQKANAAERARSEQLLLEARQALAKGNANRAQLLVQQARQLNLDYPLHADSPQHVEALVQKARAFAAGPAANAEPDTYIREFAQFLMDQGAGLLRYEAFNDAQRLAQQAKDLNAGFGQFDRTPDQLLTQIAAAREQAAKSAGNASGSRRNLSDGMAQAPRRLPSVGATAPNSKQEALRLVAQAQAAFDRGDLQRAQHLAEQAQAMAPDSAYSAQETRPWEVLLEVNRAMNRQHGVAQASAYEEQNAYATDNRRRDSFPVSQGLYNPDNDPSRTVAAQLAQPTPVPQSNSGSTASPGERLYADGLRALENRDRNAALQYFRDAWKYQQDLDPQTRQRLQDKLTLLQARPAAPTPGSADASPLEAVDAKQQLLRQKLFREIMSEQNEAQKMSVTDPKSALVRLEQLRQRVSESELDPGSKKQLLTLVDRNLESLQQYIEMNRSDIELAERNREVLESVNLDSQRETEINDKIADLVEQFNQLLEDQRYPEAERVARQARELAPNSAIVESLLWKARFVRRMMEQMAIDEQKEQGFYAGMTSVDESSIPGDDRTPYLFPDARQWKDYSDSRGDLLERQRQRLTEAEIQIQKAMNNKVDVKFNERPLAEVMDMLGELAGVPIVLDPVGLAAEGCTTDQPVTIRLTSQISLKSALNLILEPLHLSYVIQNEVLRITSEQTRDSNIYARVYNVADLVIPIPNFVPGYNIGLAGAIQHAHNTLGYGNNMAPLGRAPYMLAANDTGAGTSNTSVLAQMSASGMLSSLSSQGQSPMGAGPGGMGGAAMADFDTLIELITSTIAPDSWDEVGGAGAIEPFPVNLSLVISQTQDVHEQINDLLDQLRRLQDLQVTIEVRFITLNDNFFERIGIDFDFSIDDNVDASLIRGLETAGGMGDDNGPSVAIGLNENGPTTNLDLQFNQAGFGAAVPQFGNFDTATAANFGFAILSDIEVFFLLQAAEGDQRSNVLQAPKVTLFNGQTASVSDVSQQPFVTSIIPVVGDFAAANQPVITVLSEGTQLSVEAVVSPDRRFVRLTLVPFFSRIGEVDTFTFDGTTTTDTGTVVTDEEGEEVDRDNEVISQQGTTVQLPNFIFTTVSTTVSVPDGGTVLLGGIKRLSEGRTERGVPMLSKLPYVNRLFKNVGIGRETQSLMMMVTPRIIIQEEEERLQTGYDSSQ
jgi:general secretion pathway protein D